MVQDFKFTIWGIVGAGIWVVNGTLAIFAIQKAGLGISQSVWSGISSKSRTAIELGLLCNPLPLYNMDPVSVARLTAPVVHSEWVLHLGHRCGQFLSLLFGGCSSSASL
eukprot:1192718-Prorocentrum_minimum.AAC.2